MLRNAIQTYNWALTGPNLSGGTTILCYMSDQELATVLVQALNLWGEVNMGKVLLNGSAIDAEAHLIKGTTFVEVRKVMEARGDKVVWRPPDTVEIFTVRQITVDTDCRAPTGLPAKLFDQMLAGEGVLAGLGRAIVSAELKYCLNGLIMAGHAHEETGGGTSRLARERNNLFGIGAWDENPDNASRFTSREECIEWYASYVTWEYLHPRGQYYGGASTLRGMNKHWATDPAWATKCAERANLLFAKLIKR